VGIESMPGIQAGMPLTSPELAIGKSKRFRILYPAFAMGAVFGGTADEAQAPPAPPVSPPSRPEVDRVPVRPLGQRQPRLTAKGEVERPPCALADQAHRDLRSTARSAASGDSKGLNPEALPPAYAVPPRRAGLQTQSTDPRLLVSFTTRTWPWSSR
jgi:hypothetical protein